MSFTPRQTRTKPPLEDLISDFASFEFNLADAGEEDIAAYRNQLAKLRKMTGAKMAKTATKEHDYDDAVVTAYIDEVLENCFSLVATELSDAPELIDAQNLKRWADLITERVELSPFGSKTFKIHPLRRLRSNISKAKTLLALRQAAVLMIGPLELYRERCAEQEQQEASSRETMKEIESLFREIEARDMLLAERKRVIDEILAVYSEDDSELALLQNIESAKKQHKLSDTEAAGWFGLNRRQLQRLREKLIPFGDEEATLLVQDVSEPEGSPLALA